LKIENEKLKIYSAVNVKSIYFVNEFILIKF